MLFFLFVLLKKGRVAFLRCKVTKINGDRQIFFERIINITLLILDFERIATNLYNIYTTYKQRTYKKDEPQFIICHRLNFQLTTKIGRIFRLHNRGKQKFYFGKMLKKFVQYVIKWYFYRIIKRL